MIGGTYISKSTFNRLVTIALDVTKNDKDEDAIKEKIGMIIEDVAGFENQDDAEHLIIKVADEIRKKRRLGLAPKGEDQS